MMPSRFMVLDELPVTPTGKTDRRKRPVPAAFETGDESSFVGLRTSSKRPETQQYVAPRDSLERELVEAWQRVMGVEKIGTLDNFFDLGGDSIRASILLMDLQQTLGEVLYITAIIDAPTGSEERIGFEQIDQLRNIIETATPRAETPLFKNRRVVETSTSCGHELEVLRRAEADFEKPLYIHLVRHPCAMIHSYDRMRIDRALRFEHPFNPRQVAELVWVVQHQNILRFLEDVPAERQHRVHFEQLLDGPQVILEGVCRFLGLELHPDMLEPYRDGKRRMTDGLHSGSRMYGDPEFHKHKGIEADRSLDDLSSLADTEYREQIVTRNQSATPCSQLAVASSQWEHRSSSSGHSMSHGSGLDFPGKDQTLSGRKSA